MLYSKGDCITTQNHSIITIIKIFILKKFFNCIKYCFTSPIYVGWFSVTLHDSATQIIVKVRNKNYYKLFNIVCTFLKVRDSFATLLICNIVKPQVI